MERNEILKIIRYLYTQINELKEEMAEVEEIMTEILQEVKNADKS